MEKRWLWVLGIVGLLFAVGVGWWLSQPEATPSSSSSIASGETSVPSDSESVDTPRETRTVELFFPSETSLVPTPFEVSVEVSLEEQLMEILGGLAAGPGGEALRSPLPEGVKAGAVFLLEQTAYVDLVTAPSADFPTTGSLREMLTVYSLVQSLVANFEEVEAVVLLLNGRQPTTLAGHLDTTRPLREQPEWVRR